MAVAATERETSNLIVAQLDLKRLILFPLYFALPRIFFVYQAFIVVSPKISFFCFPQFYGMYGDGRLDNEETCYT